VSIYDTNSVRPVVLPYSDFIFEADIVFDKLSIEIKDFIVIRKNNIYYLQLKASRRIAFSSMTMEKIDLVLSLLDISGVSMGRSDKLALIVTKAKETGRYHSE
jgi:hypothetical protein